MRLTELHFHRWELLGFARALNPMRPPVIVEFQTGCASIIASPKQFPMLGCGKGQRRLLFTSQNRERRSERRRMMARLLSVVGEHADILTLSDGRRTGGECHPLTERQIGELLELDDELAAGEKVEHDTRGMRAMRAALRDLVDGGLLHRSQPKVQYCNELAGGCGYKVPRGGTCRCSRRWLWRWRALPTIITIAKKAFEALGLLDMLNEAQRRRVDEQRAGGVTPIRDIRIQREEKRIVVSQLRAAKRAQLQPEHDERRKADNDRRLSRLFGKKLE